MTEIIKQPKSKQHTVATVVVTWNSAGFVARCLDSLLATHHPMQIVVVDNDSSDGTIAFIREHYPDITLILSDTNLGYAGGNNLGIKLCIERGVDYIFILNPDAFIEAECIDKLAQRLDNDSTLAVVSPMIYYSDSNAIWYAGSTIDWKTGETPHCGNGEEDSGAYDAVTMTERASGCAMLVRSSIVAEVGFMDERYFLYFEELDWCIRFIEHGYKIGFVASAKVWHAVSSSTGGYGGNLYQYYTTRNRLLFMSQYSTGSFTLFLLRHFIHVAIDALAILHRSSLRSFWRYVRTTSAGVSDFFHHRFGRRLNPVWVDSK